MREKNGIEPGEIKFFASLMKPNLKTWLMALFVVATMALFSGCAPTGDDAEPTTPPDDTAMPTEPTEPTEPPVVTPPPPSPYQVLVQGKNKAKDAADMADMAKKDAGKYSDMIGVASSGGDSMKAQMNAQMVLDSRKKIEMYLMNAKDARKELVDAKEGADDAAMKALDKGIMDVDGYIKKIQMILDDESKDSLADYIDRVQGSGKKPITPADRGQEVAKKIYEALMPVEGNDPAGLAIKTVDDDNAAHDDAVKSDNHLGHKWEEIVGASNVMDFNIADAETAGETNSVRAASVNGQSIGQKGSEALPNCSTTESDCNNGMQHPVSWKGIDGRIFCNGKDCKINGTVLMGSWYFTPDSMTYYLRDPDNRDQYKKEVYVEYGYWLDDKTTGEKLVNVYSSVMNGPDPAVPGKWDADTAGKLETKAEYSGNAIGLYNKFSGKGDNRTYQSGRFSADVELTAMFGATDAQKVSGMIDDFRDVNNRVIDSSWEVTLKSPATIDGSVDEGVTDTGERTADGEWIVSSVGATGDLRPHILHGTFNAHFSNGDAAGAYATRKD